MIEEGAAAANPAVFPNTVYNAAGGQTAIKSARSGRPRPSPRARGGRAGAHYGSTSDVGPGRRDASHRRRLPDRHRRRGYQGARGARRLGSTPTAGASRSRRAASRRRRARRRSGGARRHASTARSPATAMTSDASGRRRWTRRARASTRDAPGARAGRRRRRRRSSRCGRTRPGSRSPTRPRRRRSSGCFGADVKSNAEGQARRAAGRGRGAEHRARAPGLAAGDGAGPVAGQHSRSAARTSPSCSPHSNDLPERAPPPGRIGAKRRKDQLKQVTSSARARACPASRSTTSRWPAAGPASRRRPRGHPGQDAPLDRRPETGEHRETTRDGRRGGPRGARIAGLDPEEVDLIVVSTASPEYHLPAPSTFVQEKLGLRSCAAVDCARAAPAAVEALDLARLYLERGDYETALVIGTRGDLAARRAGLPGQGPREAPHARPLGIYNFGDGAGASCCAARTARARASSARRIACVGPG